MNPPEFMNSFKFINIYKIKYSNLLQIFLALRGVAITIVVAAHCAIGLIAAELNLSSIDKIIHFSIGNLEYVSFFKFSILELARVSVPLFLFLAGYHMSRSIRSWPAIWNNSKKLFYPMIFWSFIAWGISWRNGFGGWTITEFIQLFLSGKAQLGYYFIILIIQFYILSKWLVPAILNRPLRILFICLLIQLFVHFYDYLYLLNQLHIIKIQLISLNTFPEYLFPRFLVSFSLGIWASGYIKSFKKITDNHLNLLIILSIVSCLFLFVEHGTIFYISRNLLNESLFVSAANSWVEWKISTAAWSIIGIFLIISLIRRWLPLKKLFEYLGKNSYQIFLVHGMVIHFLTLFCYKYMSGIYWFGIFGFLVWFFLTTFVSCAIIFLIRKFGPKWTQSIMLGT